MARVDWIERRLLNWARWKLNSGSGPLGYAGVDLSNPTPEVRDPYTEAPIPTLGVEASETDDAVQRLPSELKATVLEYYTGKGGLNDHLRRLVCAKATMYARLERADRLLAEHFNARDDKARSERKRLEALQATARPGAIERSFTP